MKAVQELSESFDVIVSHPQYQQFLDLAMRIFLKLLQVTGFFFTVYGLSLRDKLVGNQLIALVRVLACSCGGKCFESTHINPKL